jgi:type IV pilus assembly protein PilF
MQKKLFAAAGTIGLFCIGMMLCACSHTGSSVQVQQAAAARNLGEAYMADGNYTKALRELLKAELLNPKDPYVHNDLGLTYMAKGDPDKGVTHFKRALELRPEYSPARNNLGSAYISLEQWDKAIDCFEDVADDLLYATPYYPLSNLGYVYFRKGDYHRAEGYYRQALDLEYDFPKALHGLGKVYLAMGKPEKALEVLERAKKKAPDVAPIYMDLGRAYTGKHEYHKALDAYKKAAALARGTALGDQAEEAAGRVKNMW